MLDKEHARDCLLDGEVEISYLEGFPVSDLTPLKNIAPPGTFFPVPDCIKLLKDHQKRLLELSPHPKNCSAVGITSDLKLLALVRVPSKQQEIDYDEDGISNLPKTLRKLADEEAATASAAIDRASQIQLAQVAGLVKSIEDLDDELAKSPNPVVTRAALEQFGKNKIEFTLDNQKLEVGGRTPFPTTLGSKERYIFALQFRQGIDEQNNTAHATVISACIDDKLTQSLLRSSSISVDILEASEARALVASQLGRVAVMAESSICVDVFTGKPEKLSLIRVLNKAEIRDALKTHMEQGVLDFENW
jgi:hypothetical protein